MNIREVAHGGAPRVVYVALVFENEGSSSPDVWSGVSVKSPDDAVANLRGMASDVGHYVEDTVPVRVFEVTL